MGYSYTQGGELICDICSEPGARKYSCPFGYCPPTAACPKCRKEKAHYFGRVCHREAGCEQAHNNFVARGQERAAAIASGAFCLKSALGIWKAGKDTGLVHVIFEGPAGAYAGRYIPAELYTFTTGNETIEFFENRNGGPLPIAPLDFHSKEVSPAELLAEVQP